MNHLKVATVFSLRSFKTHDVISERGRNCARMEEVGVCSRVGVARSEKLFQLPKWSVQHELLPAVLIVLGTHGIRGAARADNDDHLLYPEDWGLTSFLWCTTALDKLQESHVFKLWSAGTGTVVVEL